MLADFFERATVSTRARTIKDVHWAGVLHVLPVLVCQDLHENPAQAEVIASLEQAEVSAALASCTPQPCEGLGIV